MSVQLEKSVVAWNLGEDVGRDDVKDLFESVGAVSSIKLLVDAGERSVLVQFVDSDDADGAVSMLEGTLMGGERIHVRRAEEGDLARVGGSVVVDSEDDDSDDDEEDDEALRSRLGRGRSHRDEEEARRRKSRHGKHGSDRVRSRGQRREID